MPEDAGLSDLSQAPQGSSLIPVANVSSSLNHPAPANSAEERFTSSSSASLEDPAWESFLQSTPLGHFQQSAMWAQYKAHEGWQAERIVFSDGAGVLAGFQLLWRRSRLGRIGYISKGPAARDSVTAPWEELTRQIQHAARRLRLQAVIVQPPDWAPEAVPVLRRHGFLDNHLHPVIRQTLLVDLRAGWYAVEAGFRKGARRAIEKARRHGYRVVDGRRQDLPRFFALMQSMCSRLGTQPNPGSEHALCALWDCFANHGLVRLLLACRGAEVLGALLIVRFGDRLTAWKQGCDVDKVSIRPDPMLFGEAIRGGAESGCRWFDFVSFHPEAASAVEASTALQSRGGQARSFFHLGFGGKPMKLPDPMIWFGNPAVRAAYGFAVCTPGLRSLFHLFR